jgi:hypothetical protein
MYIVVSSMSTFVIESQGKKHENFYKWDPVYQIPSKVGINGDFKPISNELYSAQRVQA